MAHHHTSSSASNCLVILSSSGTNPLGSVRLTDARAVRVEYDKALHGNVIHLTGDPTTTKLQLPKEDRPVYALQLTNSYIAVQVFIPACSSNLFEFVLGDGPTNRLRLCFGTFYHKAEACNKQGTHVRVPLAVPRNVWSIILFDVEKLAKYYLKVAQFRSIDAVVLGGEMRLRKIISLKDPLPDHYTPWNGILPRDVELPPGTAYTVVAFSPPTVKAAEPAPPPPPPPPPPSVNKEEGDKSKLANIGTGFFQLLPEHGAHPDPAIAAIGTSASMIPKDSLCLPRDLAARKDAQGLGAKQPQDVTTPGHASGPPTSPPPSEVLRFMMNQNDGYVRILSDETDMTSAQRKASNVVKRKAGQIGNKVVGSAGDVPSGGLLTDPSDFHEDERPSGWEDASFGQMQSTQPPKNNAPPTNRLGTSGGLGALGNGLEDEIPADKYSPRAPVGQLTGWAPYVPITHSDSEEEEEE